MFKMDIEGNEEKVDYPYVFEFRSIGNLWVVHTVPAKWGEHNPDGPYMVSHMETGCGTQLSIGVRLTVAEAMIDASDFFVKNQHRISEVISELTSADV